MPRIKETVSTTTINASISTSTATANNTIPRGCWPTGGILTIGILPSCVEMQRRADIQTYGLTSHRDIRLQLTCDKVFCRKHLSSVRYNCMVKTITLEKLSVAPAGFFYQSDLCGAGYSGARQEVNGASVEF